jgi:hypothetical protein
MNVNETNNENKKILEFTEGQNRVDDVVMDFHSRLQESSVTTLQHLLWLYQYVLEMLYKLGKAAIPHEEAKVQLTDSLDNESTCLWISGQITSTYPEEEFKALTRDGLMLYSHFARLVLMKADDRRRFEESVPRDHLSVKEFVEQIHAELGNAQGPRLPGDHLSVGDRMVKSWNRYRHFREALNSDFEIFKMVLDPTSSEENRSWENLKKYNTILAHMVVALDIYIEAIREILTTVPFSANPSEEEAENLE